MQIKFFSFFIYPLIIIKISIISIYYIIIFEPYIFQNKHLIDKILLVLFHLLSNVVNYFSVVTTLSSVTSRPCVCTEFCPNTLLIITPVTASWAFSFSLLPSLSSNILALSVLHHRIPNPWPGPLYRLVCCQSVLAGLRLPEDTVFFVAVTAFFAALFMADAAPDFTALVLDGLCPSGPAVGKDSLWPVGTLYRRCWFRSHSPWKLIAGILHSTAPYSSRSSYVIHSGASSIKSIRYARRSSHSSSDTI